MKQKFSISGMSCSACSARVEKVTSALPGVKKAEVNLLSGTMQATFSEELCSAEKIIAAVEGAGYGAKIFDISSPRRKAREEELQKMKKRIILSACFLVPLMYLSMGKMLSLPLPEFLRQTIPAACGELLLLLPILILNFSYFSRGFKNLFTLAPNMDSLIAVGASASILYGIYTLVRLCLPGSAENLTQDFYFESAGMILTLVTLGKFFETRSKGQTGAALERLLDLSPETALVLRDGKELEIPAAEVSVGDIVILKPGMRVPVDGVILEGLTAIDQSALTGESIPAEKQPGDRVAAATVNLTGSVKIRAERVGQDTALAEIIRLVEDAGSSKAPIARLADKIAGIFVPMVMGVALVTLVIWLLVGQEFEFALIRAVSVLVISCPCALGLATPVSVMVGTGKGAEYGILYKSAEALELLSRVDAVVLDKTGTLTEGKPRVTDVLPAKGTREEFLQLAASLEKGSEHPLAAAVAACAAGLPLFDARDFEAVPGRGVRGLVMGKTVLGGNAAFLEQSGIALPRREDLEGEGKTLLYFAADGEFLGVIAAADSVKPTAQSAVQTLKEMGLRTYLLTGDNESAARAVGRTVGADEIIAQVLPQEKEAKIRALQDAGLRVCMVGDGINDAPALTRAEVGVAIGAGTDIAMDAADVVLMRSEPTDICTGIELSRAVLKNIRLSLFWAFIYNILGIPIAAGVLYGAIGLTLNPMIAAAAMSLSSVCVVSNALRLRSFRPKITKTEEETNMEIILKVTGMMCDHCRAHVENALRGVEGVSAVTVDLQAGKATVTGGDASALIEAVKAAGYGCEAE